MKLDPETIRALASWGDRHGEEHYWRYDGVSDKLRALARRVEASGDLGGPLTEAEVEVSEKV